jgi:hypothetical protein
MVFIIKDSINVLSHADGKRYTSRREYERSLDKKSMQIMPDQQYKLMKEKIMDEIHSKPKKKEIYNHVHIDMANDRIEKSYKEDI